MRYNYLKIVLFCLLVCCFSCKREVNNQQEDARTINEDNRDIIHHQNENIINDDARNYFNQGLSFINEGNYKESEYFFSKANELEPDNIIILDALANLEMKVGSFEKALKMYENNIKQYPTYFNSYSNYSSLLAYNNEYQKAIEILNIGEEYLPNDSFKVSIYYLNLAFYYMNINKCAKAKEYVNESLKTSKDNYIQEYSKKSLKEIEINCKEI
jgi:tetratricopeptide (TPR) repeat protein